jgi:hypothetical protein
MLGATFTAATARHVEATGEGDTARRRAAIAEVAAVTIETAFRWFGLVDVAEGGRRERLVRLTAAGRAAAEAEPASVAEKVVDGPPLVLAESGDVALRVPSPLRVWSLSAFADVERLDRVSTYRMTETSIRRALSAGFETRQIVAFLTAQTGAPVFPELERRLHGWATGFRRLRLRRALLIAPDDLALVPAIQQTIERQGLTASPFGEMLVVTFPEEAGEDQEKALTAALRDVGFTPQWDTRPLVPPRREESGGRAATHGATGGRRDRQESGET